MKISSAGEGVREWALVYCKLRLALISEELTDSNNENENEQTIQHRKAFLKSSLKNTHMFTRLFAKVIIMSEKYKTAKCRLSGD